MTRQAESKRVVLVNGIPASGKYADPDAVRAFHLTDINAGQH